MKLILCCVSLFLLINLSNEIKNGQTAKMEDFPYAAALQVFNGYKIYDYYFGLWTYKCVGAIVNEDWIITSESCILSDSEYRFFFGNEYLSLMWDFSANYRFVRYFKRVNRDKYKELPEGHVSPALAYLTEPIEFNDLINRIEINWLSKINESQSTATIAGWGSSSEGMFSFRSSSLNFVQVKISSEEKTHPSEVITIGEDAGGCSNDAGAGLVIKIDDVDALHGILFYRDSELVCVKNYYSSTIFYYEWIIHTMKYNI